MLRVKNLSLVPLLMIAIHTQSHRAAAQSPTVSPAAQQAHALITEYRGPATCVTCHETEATDVFHSVHYQWTGQTPNVTNITGNAGKGDRGFNTYCGAVVSSRRVACWSCHVGNGETPSPILSKRQLNNIDCLMCHQENYQRKAVPTIPLGDLNRNFVVDTPDVALLAQEWLHMNCDQHNDCNGADLDFSDEVNLLDFNFLAENWQKVGGLETLTFMDYLGQEHTWHLPWEDKQGNFQYAPDEENMSISILEAARTVHPPNRATCLRCHAYAAGTDCGKRGDLSSETVDPPVSVDIHMSSAGANKLCQDCHQTNHHRIKGRGLDLRPNDRPERLQCTQCHNSPPHDSSRLNNHIYRTACQTCHIPTYAKLKSTETARNWNHPVWHQGLFGGQGGYKPEETRGSNLIPTYAWFDGTSRVYALGQTAVQNNSGQYELAAPNGSVSSDHAQIYPMKEHTSNSALHVATGQLIPHATTTYFFTGDFSRAVKDGMTYAGLSGSWQMVNVHTYQTINHGVENEDHALACGQCHASLEGGPVRMNLMGDLGYELKGPHNVVCVQCHGAEENKPFKTIHDIHVKDKKFDCSWCHTFTRPERNLTLP